MRSMRMFRATIATIVLGLTGASAAAQNGLATWTLAPSPMVAIGGKGVPPTEFSQVAAAFRLSNGMIAVADGATLEIRLFDDRGSFVRAFGGGGSAPGEFQSLNWVGRSGDTAFVFDVALARITSVVLGSEPRLLHTLSIMPTSDRGHVSVSGRLADGRWLVGTPAHPGWDGPPGVHRLPASVGLIAASGSGPVEWLGQLDGLAVFVHNPTGNLQQAVVGPIAFTPTVPSAVSGSTIWFGDSHTDSLTLGTADGILLAVHLPIPRRSPSTAMVDEGRERELATARDDKARSWVMAKFSPERTPRDLPYFATLIAGPRGEMWVQEYAASRSEAARYIVVGPTGSARAWVNVPRGFRVRDVGLDYVAGVHVDDGGMETVQVYRLRRELRGGGGLNALP
jgi:hypothetical protein